MMRILAGQGSHEPGPADHPFGVRRKLRSGLLDTTFGHPAIMLRQRAERWAPVFGKADTVVRFVSAQLGGDVAGELVEG